MSAFETAALRLRQIADVDPKALGHGSRVGIEKECLRVVADGHIARTPHPAALGSALTHPYITTDFSEALLEFITPPFTDKRETLRFLRHIHQFVYANIGEELLWATSMPCVVSGDESVPIAEYGSSNVGTMKHVYRRGLSHRYGRVMQAISGVHFNYSVPKALWRIHHDQVKADEPLDAFISERYFGLIRNFQRFGWMVPYLFGSSPAVCKSFMRGRKVEGFEELDRGTWFRPYATSLRMSDIGYKNKNQAGLRIVYDGLDTYVKSLSRAIQTPFPDYETIGVKKGGEWLQLNTNILQIENEYYSFIRPKRVARSGERPTLALKRRGVQYVEVRALDVSAFDAIGVNEDQVRFLEAFVLLCLLEKSPPIGADEQCDIDYNQEIVASRGREPGLELRRPEGSATLTTCALEILDAMVGICELLDIGHAARPYSASLERQRAAVEDPERLPSARILSSMAEAGEVFFELAMRLTREHRDTLLAEPLPAKVEARFREEAALSLAQQKEIEAADSISFEEYLERYFHQSAVPREQLLA
ncbi:MAG: glutamate--cysteine ligase [Gammaproteobacteria bacterium]|nr:glutamate--cysteine ligase [Gammaproteobacteria bacterium]